jgi:hypothetical protein
MSNTEANQSRQPTPGVHLAAYRASLGPAWLRSSFGGHACERGQR